MIATQGGGGRLRRVALGEGQWQPWRPKPVLRRWAEHREKLAAFLDERPSRGRFADVPIALLDLGAARSVHAAVGGVDRCPRGGTGRHDAVAGLRQSHGGRAHGQAPRPITSGPVIGAHRRADDVRSVAEGEGRRGGTAGGSARRRRAPRLVRWHHSQQKRFTGTSLFYKPATQADVRARMCRRGQGDRGGRRSPLRDAGPRARRTRLAP